MPRQSNPNGFDLTDLINASNSRRFDEATVRAEFEVAIQARLEGLNADYYRALYNAVDVHGVTISEVARRTGYTRKTIYEHLALARARNNLAKVNIKGIAIKDGSESRSRFFSMKHDEAFPIAETQADNGITYQDGPVVSVDFATPHTPPGAGESYRPVTGKAEVQLYSMVGAPDNIVGNLPPGARARFAWRPIGGDEEVLEAIKGPVNRTGTIAAEAFAWITGQDRN